MDLESPAPTTEPTESAPKPARKPFRKFPTVRPTPEQMARQARIAGRAWAVLGDRDAVMAFLNTHHDALGGRPIDLALASDEGLEQVERVMATHAPTPA